MEVESGVWQQPMKDAGVGDRDERIVGSGDDEGGLPDRGQHEQARPQRACGELVEVSPRGSADMVPGEKTGQVGVVAGDGAAVETGTDLGQVVGVSETPSGQSHAFVWTEESGMTDLGTWAGVPN